MKTFVLIAALALPLAGCFGPSQEQIVMEDASNCVSMGFKEGSAEYGQCRMAMLQRRDNADAARRANAVNTLNNYNASIQAQQPRRIDVYTHQGY